MLISVDDVTVTNK